MQKGQLRIVVTGANGFVGRNVRRFLYHKGVELISLARKNFPNYKNERKIIISDYNSIRSILKLKNSDAMIHLVGTGIQTLDSNFQNTNVNLTKEAIRLCKNANIKKFVYISGLGVKRQTNFAYFISKYKAEKQIIKSGLDFTIFRASHIIGKDDPLTRNLSRQIKSGVILVPGSGQYHIQPISVNDVSNVILNSVISKKFSNKILNLVGPESVSYIEYVKFFIKNKRIKIKNVDLESAYHNAIHDIKYPYSLDDLNILVGNFTADHSKLKKLGNFKFANFRDVLNSRSLS